MIQLAIFELWPSEDSLAANLIEQIADPGWPEVTEDPLDALFGLDAWLLRRGSLVDEGMEIDL